MTHRWTAWKIIENGDWLKTCERCGGRLRKYNHTGQTYLQLPRDVKASEENGFPVHRLIRSCDPMPKCEGK